MACSSTKKNNSQVNNSPNTNMEIADSSLQKKQEGIDFLASGNFPVQWSVSININNEIKFNANDGAAVRVLAVPAITMPENTGVSYKVKTSTTTLSIMIYTVNCENLQQKKVEVVHNGKRYTGCGKYLQDPALDGVWVLNKINNIPQAGKDYPTGLPMLQFQVASKKVSGNDGCNRVNGSIEIMGKQIKFSPFVSTKMACSNYDAEKIYSNLLSNNLVTYYIKNNYLTLSLPDDSLIIFRKE
ncbi:MAG: META domain-containing protein [Ferruginibacter sp.]